MLIHMSMDALDPPRAAEVLAKMVGGTVVKPPTPPFDPEYRWVCCWDERGTLLEIGPSHVGLEPGETAEIQFVDHQPTQHSTYHALMMAAVPLDTVSKLADEAGWRNGLVRNANAFSVLNVWVENRRLIEFATQELLDDYLTVFGPANRERLDSSIRALEEARRDK